MTPRSGAARTYAAIAGLLALSALLAALGVWQLERAKLSAATLERFAAGGVAAALTTPPRELSDVERFRRLEVRGELIAEPQFLLDNMTRQGVAGYHVLTALRVPGLRERLLVNRGFVAASGDRTKLPDVAVAAGVRRVAGRIERLPRPALRLAAPVPAERAAGTVVLQYPTAEDVAALLGEPVFDYQLLLDAEEPGGYVREWHAPGVPPERNLAYAGQWLALALGALAAGVVMIVRTARRNP